MQYNPDINAQEIDNYNNNKIWVHEYDPLECGTGCSSRTKSCPYYSGLCVGACCANVATPCISGSFKYYPVCMGDFRCVDSYCPCCKFWAYPNSLSEGDYQGVLSTRAVKKAKVFDFSLFKTSDPDLLKTTLNFLRGQVFGQKTEIDTFNAKSCGLGQSVFKNVTDLIDDLRILHSIYLDGNLFDDEGFQALVKMMVLKPAPPKYASIRLVDSITRDMIIENMVMLSLDDNKLITETGLLAVCDIVKTIKYPIFLSLQGIFETLKTESVDAIKALKTSNPNVRILISFMYYKEIYPPIIPMPIKNIAISQTPAQFQQSQMTPMYQNLPIAEVTRTIPAPVQEMTRDPAPTQPSTVVPSSPNQKKLKFIEEFGLWETRINQCIAFYMIQQPTAPLSILIVVAMFESFTFEELVGVMLKKYPDAPLPKGWKNDLDNKFYIGYAPPDILKHIKEDGATT